MLVREVMTESVVTAPPACPARRVAEMMRERNVGSVVLVDDAGIPVGFVTDRDLAMGIVADARDASDPAEGHATSPVVTGRSEMEIEEAAELMIAHGIRRLPVIDGDRMVGIVTLDDLAVGAGDLELASRILADVTRASLPGFYFHDRGG